MKNKKTFWIYLAVFVVVIVLAGFLYKNLSLKVAKQEIGQTQEETENQDEKKAPDFVVFDKDGKEVKLSEMKGKPTVLNFWASWCGPCKMEMPHFQEVFEEMGDEINFFMVNATTGRETEKKAKSYISENNYTLPFYFDKEMNGIRTYGINAFPTTYFIDKDLNLVAVAQSAIDKDTLLKGIEMIK